MTKKVMEKLERESWNPAYSLVLEMDDAEHRYVEMMAAFFGDGMQSEPLTSDDMRKLQLLDDYVEKVVEICARVLLSKELVNHSQDPTCQPVAPQTSPS
jgi:hypothetical protein